MEVFAGLVVAGIVTAVAVLLNRNKAGESSTPDDPGLDDGFDPSTGEPPDDPIVPGVTPETPLGILGTVPDAPIGSTPPVVLTPLPGIKIGTVGTPLNPTTTPTRGRYYRVKKDDTLSAIAKMMAKNDPAMTNVEWQQFINSANSEFWKPPKGAYYESVFPNGYMGQAFLPRWSGGSTVETNTDPGKKFPAIMIP